jgi:hypothetical protein
MTIDLDDDLLDYDYSQLTIALIEVQISYIPKVKNLQSKFMTKLKKSKSKERRD